MAADINHGGQIVGYGAHYGAIHALRLTPVVQGSDVGCGDPDQAEHPQGGSHQFTATGTPSDGASADLTASAHGSI